MEIRPFHEADESAVIALWKNVFAYPAPHNDPAKVVRDKLAVQRDLFFVAVDNGAVIGTVLGGYDGHRGWIYSLAVNPDVRNQGIGTALMRHVPVVARSPDSPLWHGLLTVPRVLTEGLHKLVETSTAFGRPAVGKSVTVS